MKQKWIDAYMDTAERFAQLSSAKRLKVGAVIVKDNRIVSIGYNGMPADWDNTCEEKVYKIDGWLVDEVGCYELKTKDEVIHAEANAILKLAKFNDGGDGSSLFCTHSPCIQCAKMIYGAGIKNVYYRKSYKDNLGVEFLNNCNVVVAQVLT